ncbi:integral membrane protein GPR137C isoform X2 [Callithrix jacchus]|uniref:integral membrane protein GPR137C isoform X2 n=1 Tax=Callithrix jacchus TaxID=9483 RepID=UPI0023DD31BD|nr:integral membrane protein GPR137C isoform X2 [Callithrix jacchus]
MRVSVPGPAATAAPAAGREPSTPDGGGGGGGGAVAAASGAAVPGSVQLALSVLHALLYAALFAFAYLQLWRLLLYRERRLSYQSLCLFLCLLWAALRTTLFSAAFSLSGSLPLLRPPAHLHFFPHWLLYCFPSCLQFSTLCLLNLYLAEVICKVRCATELDKHKILLHLGFILASLVFLVVNLTCAMLVHGDVPENQLKWTVFVRALINDSLFILCAICLVSYICKIAKMSSANVYLESKAGVLWHHLGSLQPRPPGLKQSSHFSLQVAGTTGMHYHTWLIFVLFVEIMFHCVTQAGLKLLNSSSLPTSPFQRAGITGMSHEHFFVFLFAIRMSSFYNYLFKAFEHFFLFF